MSGRNAKPVALHIAEGNPNRLTKAEIQRRKNSEVKLGETDFTKLRPPKHIRDDKVAAGHWRQLMKEYKNAADQGIELLSSSDVGMLALYCKTYSEYENLLKAYQSIEGISFDSEGLDEYIEDSEEFDFRIKNQLRSMIAVDGILRIETAINKKMDMLIKMQDRLFLNPLAKVKNIAKPKKEEKVPSKFSRFGGA